MFDMFFVRNSTNFMMAYKMHKERLDYVNLGKELSKQLQHALKHNKSLDIEKAGS